jgi:uncharacterized LabA/DUF88 family protein
MGRVAVFVDAGYFWPQACLAIGADDKSRRSVEIDPTAMRKAFIDEVSKQFPSSELLRIYWYDSPAAEERPQEHAPIAALDDFKLRVGLRNGLGRQKGVDGLLMADLMGLAANKAIDSALIVSGDADMQPAIGVAQTMGLRVHLLLLGNEHFVSSHLLAEADKKTQWNNEAIAAFATPGKARKPDERQRDAGDDPLPRAAPAWNDEWIARAEDICRKLIIENDGETVVELAGRIDGYSIPSDIDRLLLGTAKRAFGRLLDPLERNDLRTFFVDHVIAAAEKEPAESKEIGWTEEDEARADTVCKRVLGYLDDSQLEELAEQLAENSATIDSDRLLLGTAKAAFGRFLEPHEKARLRSAFKAAVPTAIAERRNGGDAE